MGRHSKKIQPQDYFLRPGYIYLPDQHTSISTVLGSSVSVSVFDKKLKLGGMNHFLYPETNDQDKSTSFYGNVAVETLIHMMINSGAKIKHMEAQIFGGAFNPKLSLNDIGSNNISTARKILKSKKIRIVSEDIGGEIGRKIIFDSHNSEIAI